ncbi:MAG: hypothetical protein JSU04_10015 [Bdellovibrionales bacterium]|nr:hypothetical protein [Bdellovibrionales bacterium]
MPKKLTFAFLVAFFSTTSAFADGYFKGALLYQNNKSGSEGSQGSTVRQVIDFAAGYLDPKGWMYGVLYSTDSTSSGGGSLNRTAMGPSIGWISNKDNGPYIMATYFYTAKMDPMEGSGFGLDVGYKFAVRRIAFGFQLSKRNITYDKANGAAMGVKYVEDKLDPAFVMIVTF